MSKSKFSVDELLKEDNTASEQQQQERLRGFYSRLLNENEAAANILKKDGMYAAAF
jgi:hypothetical protein